jgi:hypothetical protein
MNITPPRSILHTIHNGMEVMDDTGNVIGTVQQVYLGEMEAQGISEGSPTDELKPNAARTLTENLARVFTVDESNMPQELRERLLHDGYIRMDSGLIHLPRYILPENIATVTPDEVVLNVERDALIKA